MRMPFSHRPFRLRPRRSGLWKPSLCLACGVISAVASLFTGATSQAGVDTWTTGAGDGTGAFNAAANWNTGSANRPPISGDSWTFGATTGVTTLTDNLTTGAANWTVAGITFAAAAPSYTINPFSTSDGFTLTGNINNSSAAAITETINDAMALSAARTVTTTTTGSTTVLGGAISGAYTLTVAGTGTTTFSNAASTFSGSTTSAAVDAITYTEGLLISAASTIGIGASSTGANSATASTLTSGPLGTGVVFITAGTSAFQAVGGAQSVGNTFVLSNAGTTFTGSNALTLNGQFIFGGSVNVTVSNSALTTFAGGMSIGKAAAQTRNATFLGGGNILINSAITNGPAGSTGFGAGTLIYTGTGTLTLSGANSYTGATTVGSATLTGGTINLQSNGALGTGTGAASSGVTVFSGNALQLQGGISTTTAVALKLSGAGLSTTSNGALENVSGANTYSGLITLGAAATIGSDAGTLTLNNAGTITGTGFGLTLTGAGSGSLASVIGTGTGTVAKTSTGQWTLSGANTYTGTTSINAGTLDFANEKALYNDTTTKWNTSSILVSSGATYAFRVADTATTGAGGDFTAADIDTLKTVGVAGAFLGLDTTDGNFTYGSVIGSAVPGQGLAKLGANTLILTGANTYTGGTVIRAGTVQPGGAGTLGGNGSALTINAAGTLDLNGTSQTVGNFSGDAGSSVTNTAATAGTLTVGGGNGTGGTFSGVISDGAGAVALSKTGTGMITLNNANAYTGATTIGNGTLALGPAGSLAGTAVTVTGATLQANGNNVIGTSGAGSLTLGTGGTLSLINSGLNTLSINNATAGATALTLGTDTISLDLGGSATADSDRINLGSGLLASVNGTTTVNLNVIGTGLNGTQQQLISWGGETGTGTFALGTITGSTGGYTLSLTANSTGLFLNEAATTTAYFKGGTSSSFATIGNFTTDQAGTTARTAPLDANTSVVFVANGAANYAPATLDGNYIVNSLNFNAGGVTLASGTGGNANTLTLASLATGVTVATGVGATPDAISANLVLGGTQSFAVTDANSTLNVSGTIGDGGTGYGLTKTGAGQLVLSGANTYGGATTVSAGSVVVNGSVIPNTAGPLGNTASAIILGDAGTSIGNASVSLLTGGAYTIARPVTIANQATTGTYTIGGSTDNPTTFSGLISAAQGFNVSQVATTGTNALNLSGGITGTASTGNVIANFANAGAVNVSTTGIADGTGGGTVGVRQSGAGTTTFSVVNTYTGGTTVAAGTLALTGTATLGGTGGSLTVNGGTLDLGGTTQTVGNFSGTGGTVADNGGASTLSIGNGNATGGNFSGALTNGTGTLSLTKVGTGTLTLSGANTFTGPTMVSAGALNIGSNGGLGTGGVAVASGAALQLTGGITTPTVVGATLNGAGVTASPNGALENVSGNNTFSGPVTLGVGASATIGSDAGTLTLNSATPITSAAVGTDLIFTGAGSGVISSAISIGASNLFKNGAGTLTLSGANTYTGATNVNAGTLAYSTTAALANSNGINLGTGTVLNYTGTGGTLATPINFSATNGPFTLGNSGTGAINYTTAPTFAAGVKTLVLGNTTDTVGGSIGGITDTPAGAVNLTKAGLTGSTWTLTGGNSTYSGTTTILGGVLSDTTLADFANSYVNLNGSGSRNYGVLQTNGTFARTISATPGAGNVAFNSNSGFAALGGNLTLNFGSTPLQWGANAFMGAGTAAMVFGSSTANAPVIMQTGFDLGQAAANLSGGYLRTIDVDGAAATVVGGNAQLFGVTGNSAQISGVITANETAAASTAAGDAGANGIVKTGPGTLILSAANTYSGATQINGGTVIAGTDSPLNAPGAFGDGHTQTYTGGGSQAGAQAIILGGVNRNGGAPGGDDGTTATGASPTVLIGGAFTVAVPIDIGGANQTLTLTGGINGTGTFVVTPTGTITTTGTYGIGGSTANTATFSGLITTGQNFSVTQATGGTLNITGGITGVGASAKTVTFNDADAVNVSGPGISNGGAGAVSVAKTNVGTLTLAASNSYGGVTTVGTALTGTPASATSNGGILSVAAAGALGGTSAITVNNGGTLLLSAVMANPTAPDTADRIGNLTPITLGTTGATGGIGGTLARGAFVSEGSGTLGGMGTLTLASNSTVDFGSQTAGQLGTLAFFGFAPTASNFTLNIINYVSHGAVAGTDGVDDRFVMFGNQSSNINDYLFNGVADATEVDLGNGYFEIVPGVVPEPSSVAVMVLGMGALGWTLRRRS